MRKGFHEPNEKPRRFYKAVEVAAADDGGHAVLLDGRHLRTPKGARLVLPTPALAEQVAAEWAAQGEVIELGYMHATRLANTALEGVSAAREATARSVADYAATDLLCYFAEAPEGLVRLHVQSWDPLLERAAREEGVSLIRATGIVHQSQPPASLDRVQAIALEQDDFALAGLAFGASLFGSAVLAIGLLRGWFSGEVAYDLSRLDEAWQEQQWGVDAEAAERTERLRGEAGVLERWFRASRAGA